MLMPLRGRGSPILNVISIPNNDVSLPAAKSEVVYPLFMPLIMR